MSSRPVSLLDRDSPRPIVIEPDDTADIVVPLIVLIIFLAFIGYMLYLLIISGFQTTSPGNPVTSDRRVNTSIVCAPGQCATDLFSGFKTCPAENVSITINPAQEVCNSRFVCDNLLTPYALQSDGSTSISGVCESNTECACLKISQCPQYIVSAFTSSNGNPYQTLAGQRLTFPQISSYVNTTGVQTTVPPIQYNNPATTFCQAPLAWLPLSNPGCNFVSAANGNSMTYQDLILCQGSISGCSGLNGSPCQQGILAIITGNPDNLTQQNINTVQYGCVQGEPCPCGFAAIFDTNFGGVICRQLPPG